VPGFGKTRLIERARALAGERDMLSLEARGAEFELAFPFGIARQLFERLVHSMDASERAGVERGASGLAVELLSPANATPVRGEPTVGLLHGIYWLAAELASRRPFALLVDDAHWADEPSLRALSYLGRRLEGLPVAMLVATRALPEVGNPLPSRCRSTPLAG
jgi:hypothetical protein